jgi:hypothetical protein
MIELRSTRHWSLGHQRWHQQRRDEQPRGRILVAEPAGLIRDVHGSQSPSAIADRHVPDRSDAEAKDQLVIVSFGENNAALFLTSPGYSTLPIELLGFLQFPGNQLVVAAASTVQVGLIVVFVLLMERLVGLGRIIRSR